MAAYYNEYDPKAAAWLRELIKQGYIADGVVDDRSIEDVRPTELVGFTQCHFFAGIGVWSYALRRAGWADNRPVWTGSCPCQPFSAAGKGAGFDDERHLWPAFHHLISQCRPDVVLGEQVASKDGLGWLDLVCVDLEATGYAAGAVDLCAAGVGAPHIRQRLWWVGERLGNANNARRKGDVLYPLRGGWDRGGPDGGTSGSGATGNVAHTGITGLQGREWRGPTGTQGSPSGHGSECGGSDGLADADFASEGMVGSCGCGLDGGGARDAWAGLGGGGSNERLADTAIFGRGEGFAHDGRLRGGNSAEGKVGRSSVNGDVGSGLADTSGIRRERGQGSEDGREHDGPDAGRQQGDDGAVGSNEVGYGSQRPGPTNGHWRNADWLFCRDGKWRPVEPGTSPLAYGAAARVGRLRGYGNAIVAQAAQAFIESVM